MNLSHEAIDPSKPGWAQHPILAQTLSSRGMKMKAENLGVAAAEETSGGDVHARRTW